jgi:hypothetical protein
MALDDNVVRDGDQGFLGFASRLNPVTLQPGMLQDSVNMRLDRGVAQTRKGAKRLAGDISTSDEPLTLSFTLAADKAATITRSSTVATVTATAHGYSNTNVVNIRGAAQSAYNGDFTISNVTANTFDYTVTGSPATPATGTILANKGPIVRNVYTGGIFAAGVFASQNYDNAAEYIVLAGPDRAFLYRQGETIETKTYPVSGVAEIIEVTDTVSVVQAYDRLYVLREADRSVAGWAEQTPTSVTTVSTTTATLTATAHGYTAGMRVRLEGGGNAAFDGQEYDILASPAPTANTFAITVPSGTANDTATTGRTIRRVKPPIYWDGGIGQFVRATAGVPAGLPATYRTMRSAGWASYINNRLILPDGRDQVVISDIGDPDTYDPFWNSFRLGQGGDDYIVAVHPWVDSSALIFMRKSIWIARIAQSSGGDYAMDSTVSSVEILTDEIGCSARNTIVTAGNFVFFLSDAGVYRLDSRLDLKLRGDTMPLSEPVADLFEAIDQTKVQRAFAVWHNNRYVIALPTTAGGDDTNNLVVAFNSLNNAWEYRDTYGIGVDQILVSTYDSERRVFNSRRVGKLWLLEENEDGTDDNATSGLSGTSVTGRIKSRRFNFGELTSKRFLRSVADAVIPDGGTVTTKINIIDPDKDESQIGTITNSSGTEENYHLKSPVRFKAHAAELIYETTSKRPQIRSLALEAANKSLPATLTRNEN